MPRRIVDVRERPVRIMDGLGAVAAREGTLYEGGAPMPPSGGPPAPVDLFDGRTTGFGDMYYVGLFAPSEGTDMLNGKFLWGVGFDLGLPTATDDLLGTGKWTAGHLISIAQNDAVLGIERSIRQV